MKSMSAIQRACICALCIALCYVLPMAFHVFGMGSVFCPIHIPVLLCGLICGWPFGLFCGIAGPILSSVLSGMPSTTQLFYMVPELATYGFLSGLFMHLIHTKHSFADLYLALIPAMLCGRIIGGAAKALFYTLGLVKEEAYTLAIWAVSYFVQTLPGAIIQIVLLPALVLLLMKARLIPPRYIKKEKLQNG